MDNLQTMVQEVKDILKIYRNTLSINYKKSIINNLWWLQFFSYKIVLLIFIALYAKLSKFNSSTFIKPMLHRKNL